MKLSRKTISGFSLLDVVFGVSILAVGLAGIYSLFFFGISTLRTADNNAFANKNLAQRLAQIQRTPGWGNVTSPSYISALFSSSVTATTQNLTGITQESVTISAAAIPYASPVPSSTPTPTTYTSFTVTRTIAASGGSVSSSSSSSLSGASAVKVNLNIQWNDQAGRSHTRELSTILSNAGITR